MRAIVRLCLVVAVMSAPPLQAQDAVALVRACADLAGSAADAQRPDGVVGVARGDMDAPMAVAACEAALHAAPDDAGTAFNLGRALAVRAQDADLPRMAALYKQSADQGYVVGMINYGQALELGLGVAIDYPAAVAYYRQAAEAGHPIGANNLGLMLDTGRGIAQDHVAAAKWYQIAVDGGDSTAMLNLGQLYDDGLGVPRDYAKARALYEQAADKGEAGALTSLGWLIDRGLGGFALDHVKANEFYKRASEAGDSRGTNNLGESLVLGEGITKDEAAGLALIEQAYDEGNDMAAYNLARFYARGQHVAADPSKAARYYLEAIARNSDEAKVELLDHAGMDLPSVVLEALYAEMDAQGLAVTATSDRLSQSAIDVLKGTVQP
ncbi:MAG: tetratricopeptide repeat protein [Cypionkella sp.]